MADVMFKFRRKYDSINNNTKHNNNQIKIIKGNNNKCECEIMQAMIIATERWPLAPSCYNVPRSQNIIKSFN